MLANNGLNCAYTVSPPNIGHTTWLIPKITVMEVCLLDLLDSWEVSLRAENKSPATIRDYLRDGRMYLKWCEQNEHPIEITRAQVQAYTAELMAAGKEANTARRRQAALRAFSRWLVEEGELGVC